MRTRDLILLHAALSSASASVITSQVHVFVGGMIAPWGTKYYCFRVPSIVRAPSGTLLAFVEARVEWPCLDQSPKDIVMRRSTDGRVAWSAMERVVGPAHHAPSPGKGLPVDFSSRNPYAVVGPNGSVLLGWTNTSNEARARNHQQASTDTGATWSAPRPADFGAFEGLLAGPGTAIVLGRAAPRSPHMGRVVGCGAG